MRVFLPLSALGALTLAVAALGLDGCSVCMTDDSQPAGPWYPEISALASDSSGSEAVAFAFWRHSIHSCDGIVSAPALHEVHGLDARTHETRLVVSTIVRIGERFVAEGFLEDQPVLVTGLLTEPAAAEVTVLPGRVTSLVAVADRAFFTMAGQSVVRVVDSSDRTLSVASPTALTTDGERVYVASGAGSVTGIDAATLAVVGTFNTCPAYAISVFGAGSFVLACDAGAEVRDGAGTLLATLATNERFLRLQGSPERAAAIAEVEGSFITIRLLVAGSGLVGAGVEPDSYGYGVRTSDALFVGTNALIAIDGFTYRFSLVTGDATPFGFRADALAWAGNRGVAAGRYDLESLAVWRFDPETGAVEERVPLSPPPSLFRWSD